MNLHDYLAACPKSGPLLLAAMAMAALLGVLLACVSWLDARDARRRYEADKPLLDARLREALDNVRRQAEFEETCRRG